MCKQELLPLFHSAGVEDNASVNTDTPALWMADIEAQKRKSKVLKNYTETVTETAHTRDPSH